MRAQAGVGRLGIITRLKLPVVPQAVVKRSLDITSIDEFARQLTEVQEDYVAAKAAGTANAVEQTFLAISEVQVLRPPVEPAAHAGICQWSIDLPMVPVYQQLSKPLWQHTNL